MGWRGPGETTQELDESHNNSHSRSDCKLFGLDFLMLKPQFLQWSYMGLPMCAAFSIENHYVFLHMYCKMRALLQKLNIGSAIDY